MSTSPIPFDSLSAAAQRATSPKSPKPARMMCAKGMAPMPPKDLVTAQFVLTFDADDGIAEAARESLMNLDPRLANAILGDTTLNPFVLGYLAEALVHRDGDIERLLLNPTTPDSAFVVAAGKGSEAICTIIANNQARVLQAPDIAKSLSNNPKALKSTVDRVIDFLVRSGIILEGVAAFDDALLRLSGKERLAAAAAVEVPEELIDPRFSASMESFLDEDDADEDRRMIAEEDDLVAEDDEVKKTVEQIIKDCTTGQKVALATKGNKSVRSILIRDTNRIVALAAISAPTVNENEAVRAAQSRTVHADVIGYISRNKDWVKNYQIKLALAGNPKCPLPTSMRLIPLLQKRDLKSLSKSKNVPMGVRNLAGKLSKQRR